MSFEIDLTGKVTIVTLQNSTKSWDIPIASIKYYKLVPQALTGNNVVIKIPSLIFLFFRSTHHTSNLAND